MKIDGPTRPTLFLGYTFTKDGMEVDRKKIAAVVKLPNPTNQTEVRSLLGMTNFFSRFVPHYATITEPLRQLTHKDCKWKWSSEHDKAFDQLREALSKAPTLAYTSMKPKTRQSMLMLVRSA